LYEDTDNGTNYVSFKAPDTIASNVTWTLPSADGSASQFLQTNGSGTLSFASGGSTSPAGSNTQVQFNNSGAFGASANFTYTAGTLSSLATTSSAYYGEADSGYAIFDAVTNSSGARFNITGGSAANGAVLVGFNSTRTGYTPVNYNASEHIFKLSAVEALRLNSNGALILKDGSTSANGVGITFPATQSASSDANTLDDYDEYTAANTACTGALIVSVSWKLVKVGKLVTLTIPSTYGAAQAASTVVYGVAIPTKYKPSANLSFPCPVTDSGTNQASPGLIFITSSTGVITLYKSMGFSNFTNSSDCGVGDSTSGFSFSWTI
jgi:hypothetical protein